MCIIYTTTMSVTNTLYIIADLLELLKTSTSGQDYRPFKSKSAVLLYLLVHSPYPVVRITCVIIILSNKFFIIGI